MKFKMNWIVGQKAGSEKEENKTKENISKR